MKEYVLSCCSTADLSAQHFADRGIEYVCFHFSLDGRQYDDDLGKSIAFPDFYRAMAEGADTKTSQVNVNEFVEYFTPFLQSGRDVVHVSLSSGLSGAYSAACVAAQQLAERFPQRRVYVVDSLGASSGYGLLMDKLADLRDGGMDAPTLYQWALDHRLEVHHWFFSTDLSFYVKGGRISKTSGMVGTLLGICPLLNMDRLGRLIPRAKIRTKKKVYEEIVHRMELFAQNGTGYTGKCYISQSACQEDARIVAQLIEQRFPSLCGKVEINWVGTTIGSHTGPGTVALFFWGCERAD